MTIFVKAAEDGSITAVVTHPTKTSLDGFVKVTNGVDQGTGELTVGSSKIDFSLFVEYFHMFSIDENGAVSFKTGITVDNFVETGKLTSLDTEIPLSFTRANTVVNFGRL